jgi:hypothetical protein
VETLEDNCEAVEQAIDGVNAVLLRSLLARRNRGDCLDMAAEKAAAHGGSDHGGSKGRR